MLHWRKLLKDLYLEKLHNMLKGKCSIFGGPDDKGMTPQEGLAVYEHHEADLRLDLFYQRSEHQTLGTSKRLKPDAYYFAYRFPLNPRPERSILQASQWLFHNPTSGKFCVAWLTDYGPHPDTGRCFDLSHGLANALQVETDSIIQGCDVLELKTFFVS